MTLVELTKCQDDNRWQARSFGIELVELNREDECWVLSITSAKMVSPKSGEEVFPIFSSRKKCEDFLERAGSSLKPVRTVLGLAADLALSKGSSKMVLDPKEEIAEHALMIYLELRERKSRG